MAFCFCGAGGAGDSYGSMLTRLQQGAQRGLLDLDAVETLARQAAADGGPAGAKQGGDILRRLWKQARAEKAAAPRAALTEAFDVCSAALLGAEHPARGPLARQDAARLVGELLAAAGPASSSSAASPAPSGVDDDDDDDDEDEIDGGPKKASSSGSAQGAGSQRVICEALGLWAGILPEGMKKAQELRSKAEARAIAEGVQDWSYGTAEVAEGTDVPRERSPQDWRKCMGSRMDEHELASVVRAALVDGQLGELAKLMVPGTVEARVQCEAFTKVVLATVGGTICGHARSAQLEALEKVVGSAAPPEKMDLKQAEALAEDLLKDLLIRVRKSTEQPYTGGSSVISHIIQCLIVGQNGPAEEESDDDEDGVLAGGPPLAGGERCAFEMLRLAMFSSDGGPLSARRKRVNPSWRDIALELLLKFITDESLTSKAFGEDLTSALRRASQKQRPLARTVLKEIAAKADPTELSDFALGGFLRRQAVRDCRGLGLKEPTRPIEQAIAVNSALVVRDSAAPSPSRDPRQVSKSEEKMLRHIFDTVDVNGDGSINKRELIKAVRKDQIVARFFGLPAEIQQEDGSRERLEEVFQGLDRNEDREITWEEFFDFYSREIDEADGPWRGAGSSMSLPTLRIISGISSDGQPASAGNPMKFEEDDDDDEHDDDERQEPVVGRQQQQQEQLQPPPPMLTAGRAGAGVAALLDDDDDDDDEESEEKAMFLNRLYGGISDGNDGHVSRNAFFEFLHQEGPDLQNCFQLPQDFKSGSSASSGDIGDKAVFNKDFVRHLLNGMSCEELDGIKFRMLPSELVQDGATRGELEAGLASKGESLMPTEAKALGDTDELIDESDCSLAAVGKFGTSVEFSSSIDDCDLSLPIPESLPQGPEVSAFKPSSMEGRAVQPQREVDDVEEESLGDDDNIAFLGGALRASAQSSSAAGASSCIVQDLAAASMSRSLPRTISGQLGPPPPPPPFPNGWAPPVEDASAPKNGAQKAQPPPPPLPLGFHPPPVPSAESSPVGSQTHYPSPGTLYRKAVAAEPPPPKPWIAPSPKLAASLGVTTSSSISATQTLAARGAALPASLSASFTNVSTLPMQQPQELTLLHHFGDPAGEAVIGVPEKPCLPHGVAEILPQEVEQYEQSIEGQLDGMQVEDETFEEFSPTQAPNNEGPYMTDSDYIEDHVEEEDEQVAGDVVTGAVQDSPFLWAHEQDGKDNESGASPLAYALPSSSPSPQRLPPSSPFPQPSEGHASIGSKTSALPSARYSDKPSTRRVLEGQSEQIRLTGRSSAPPSGRAPFYSERNEAAQEEIHFLGQAALESQRSRSIPPMQVERAGSISEGADASSRIGHTNTGRSVERLSAPSGTNASLQLLETLHRENTEMSHSLVEAEADLEMSEVAANLDGRTSVRGWAAGQADAVAGGGRQQRFFDGTEEEVPEEQTPLPSNIESLLTKLCSDNERMHQQVESLTQQHAALSQMMGNRSGQQQQAHAWATTAACGANPLLYPHTGTAHISQGIAGCSNGFPQQMSFGHPPWGSMDRQQFQHGQFQHGQFHPGTATTLGHASLPVQQQFQQQQQQLQQHQQHQRQRFQFCRRRKPLRTKAGLAGRPD